MLTVIFNFGATPHLRSLYRMASKRMVAYYTPPWTIAPNIFSIFTRIQIGIYYRRLPIVD